VNRAVNERNKDLPGDTRRYFERAAGSFDRLYSESEQGLVSRWINRRFRSDIIGRYLSACDHVRQAKPVSVLDVGCGSGRYLAACAGLGVRRMVGVDLSQPMLDLAEAQVREAGHHNTSLLRGDFDEMAINESFDIVIAMGFFDYQSDASAVLRRMRSVTRHSVIASFPSRHWFRTPLRRVRYWLKRCPVFFYDAAAISTLAREAGFDAVETKKLPGAGMDYVAIFRISA
jgi:ubiquinone/menaquinone biosynthesis C-methylase UbiE